ncbi:galactokinase family protein [Flavobacterium sp. TMP13]|uniref:GHMP family kinase ATP-binding protein n=1 Tax=unclassified Flavobacterium TaxID=196869 RepID=UPI00076C0A64|nr:galactokinase family protein [Flavobacterium sp. TAB 87]KVV15664.1 Galactokinase [Flavobacterium sp. TAB 87]
MKKIISVAPGRICLFGDHQDYLGLPVIACAIDRKIQLEAIENDSDEFRIHMIDINESRTINIRATFEDLEQRDYFASALRVLRRHGCEPNKGYDITVTGNIPINSGTSSSSALLLAWINFLATAFGVNEEITPEFIARIGYLSEVVEHGEPGGMMDHYSIGIGNVIQIDTRSPFSYEVIGSEVNGLISGVSGVPKQTIGLIGELKTNALLAISAIMEHFPYFNLNETSVSDLDKYRNYLPDRLIPFFEAAIINHHCTQRAIVEFQKEVLDLKKIGQLMNEHHAVLRDLLKITVPRIDAMINAALNAGAYGAKIVGSGGGGSIVVMAEPGKEAPIVQAILNAGAVDAYAVKVNPGAQIVQKL